MKTNVLGVQYDNVTMAEALDTGAGAAAAARGLVLCDAECRNGL